MWYYLVILSSDWIPPKEVPICMTTIYEEDKWVESYAVMFYYAILCLLGSEIYPTNATEYLVSTLIMIAGSIIMGAIIGEFCNILAEISRRSRKLNEEFDMITAIMYALKVPEEY